MKTGRDKQLNRYLVLIKPKLGLIVTIFVTCQQTARFFDRKLAAVPDVVRAIIAPATIRKHASFVPGPRIFYCYSLLFSAGQKVCVVNLHNITKEVTLCSHDLFV